MAQGPFASTAWIRGRADGSAEHCGGIRDYVHLRNAIFESDPDSALHSIVRDKLYDSSQTRSLTARSCVQYSGVGLDDAFILIGSYERTDSDKEAPERIRETIGDIGLSITLTTLTSAVAFGLGCQSSVYAVVWLCSYAVPLILLVFLYTLTFFVALIVLDEQRIKSGRFDCCVCVSSRQTTTQTSTEPYSRDHAIGKSVGDLFVDTRSNKLTLNS